MPWVSSRPRRTRSRPGSSVSRTFSSELVEPAEHRGPFDEWLLQRSGVEGLAIAAQSVRLARSPEAGFDGIVRGVRPTPAGPRLEVSIEGRVVVARPALAAGTRLPMLGDMVRVQFDENALHPLGAARRKGEGR